MKTKTKNHPRDERNNVVVFPESPAVKDGEMSADKLQIGATVSHSRDDRSAGQNYNVQHGFSSSAAAPKSCAACAATIGVRQSEKHCPGCRLEMRVNALTAKGKLSPAAWKRLHGIFSLPRAFVKLPPEKARSLLKLLDAFVVRYSFDEQDGQTDLEFIEALITLPKLPRVFVKTIKRKIKKMSGDSSPEIVSKNDDPTVFTRVDRRRPFTVQEFTNVAARQGSYCYWCGVKVVREAQIAPHLRAGNGDKTLLYYERGKLREAALATIDHLVRVTDDGTNDPANLVVSCLACNLERERVTTAYGRPFARERIICETCGGNFYHSGWKCCSICGDVPRRAGGLAQRLKKFLGSLIKSAHFLFSKR